MVAAAAQPVSPRDVVQEAVTRALAVVEDVGDKRDGAARAEIRRIAGELFDFDEMARRSLSRHWAARTSTEQAEFVQLFTDLLERAYLGRIRAYTGEEIVYLGEEIDNPFATVKSKVVTGRRTGTTLDYRLLQKDGHWKVYDVLVRGSSVVASYREEFSRIIHASSYGGLVQRLREKNVLPVNLRRFSS
jgi:phospholipid transport system substrate-binding protein